MQSQIILGDFKYHSFHKQGPFINKVNHSSQLSCLCADTVTLELQTLLETNILHFCPQEGLWWSSKRRITARVEVMVADKRNKVVKFTLGRKMSISDVSASDRQLI